MQYIETVSGNGRSITLADGTRWRVSPGDSTTALCWYPGKSVEVEDNPDEESDYPYIMTDESESEIEVKRAGMRGLKL
jgi:hypothetical protein